MSPCTILGGVSAKYCATVATRPGQGKGGTPRPMLSELRLAKLMAARGQQRAVLLKHAAQMILRSRQDIGVNVSDIALALLWPADGRRLAEPYYLRLDRAEQAVRESEKGATQ